MSNIRNNLLGINFSVSWREDAAVRNQVASKARDIAKRMAAFMGESA